MIEREKDLLRELLEKYLEELETNEPDALSAIESVESVLEEL